MSGNDGRTAAMAKSVLRREMAARRDAIGQAEREAWSNAACGRAADWLGRNAAPASVMLYAPFRSELDTRPLMEWAWRQEIGVAVPKCYPEDVSMRLYFIAGPEQLKPGAYGIPEPDGGLASPCPDDYVPDAVIVPGLAFDAGGGRLGYGAGYYDRFRERQERLAASRGVRRPHWVGIGFGVQLIGRVPMEPHDARLDAVITERATHIRAQEEGEAAWRGNGSRAKG